MDDVEVVAVFQNPQSSKRSHTTSYKTPQQWKQGKKQKKKTEKNSIYVTLPWHNENKTKKEIIKHFPQFKQQKRSLLKSLRHVFREGKRMKGRREGRRMKNQGRVQKRARMEGGLWRVSEGRVHGLGHTLIPSNINETLPELQPRVLYLGRRHPPALPCYRYF